MVWVFPPWKLRPWSAFLLSSINTVFGVVWVWVWVLLSPWSEVPPAKSETLGTGKRMSIERYTQMKTSICVPVRGTSEGVTHREAEDRFFYIFSWGLLPCNPRSSTSLTDRAFKQNWNHELPWGATIKSVSEIETLEHFTSASVISRVQVYRCARNHYRINSLLAQSLYLQCSLTGIQERICIRNERLSASIPTGLFL